MKDNLNPTFEEYKVGKELTGRSSKKARAEHDRALWIGWYNAYSLPQKRLIEQANKIINR